jgi:hypothetical protein
MGPATRRSGAYRGGTRTRWRSAARNGFPVPFANEILRFVTAHHAAQDTRSRRAGYDAREEKRVADSFEITPEMQAVVGVESPAWTVEVTSTSARAFARGVGYTDAAYFVPDAARAAGYAAVPAVPTYLGTPVYDPRVCDSRYGVPNFPDAPDLKVPLRNVLDGGAETIYERPIVVGDVLTQTSKVASLETRRSPSLGVMLVVTRETSLRDPQGKLVATQLSQLLFY